MSNKKFILNADDFGLSNEINRAVVEGYNNGFLRSASLCANGNAFITAVNEIMPECPDLCIGIHLNIIEGQSLHNYTEIPSLVNSNNTFNNGFIQLLMKSYSNDFINQLEKEFRAQIEKILTYTQPAHIDSHVHTHGIPNIFKLTCKLAKEYNIPYIRTQFEKPYITPVLNKNLNLKYPINQIKVILLNSFTLKNREVAKYYGLKTNDYLVGVSYTGMMDNNTVDNGLKTFKNDEGMLVESLIHPYYSEKSSEFQLTKNQNMKHNIEQYGFEFTTYKQLAEQYYEKI